MQVQASCTGVLGGLLTSEYPAAAAPKVRRRMSSRGQVAAAAGSVRDSGSGSAPRPSSARRCPRRQLPICHSRPRNLGPGLLGCGCAGRR